MDSPLSSEGFFATAWPLVLETYEGVDSSFTEDGIDQTIGYAVAQSGVANPDSVDTSAFRSDIVDMARDMQAAQ